MNRFAPTDSGGMVDGEVGRAVPVGNLASRPQIAGASPPVQTRPGLGLRQYPNPALPSRSS